MAALGEDVMTSLASLQYVFQHLWLDHQTRGVFVEFNLYNANTNLFTAVSLLLERAASGGIHPYPMTRTTNVYGYLGARALLRLILEIGELWYGYTSMQAPHRILRLLLIEAST